MDEGCVYVLERDPDLGFGFTLDNSNGKYYLMNLSLEGPANRNRLENYSRVLRLNGIQISGLHAEQVESIINSETFLSLHIQEYSPTTIRKSLKSSFKSSTSPTRSIIGLKLRTCSSLSSYSSHMTSSNSNFDFSQVNMMPHKNSFSKNSLSNISLASIKNNLSLDVRTLQMLKKIETKKYHNLIDKTQTKAYESTDFVSDKIEKELADCIKSIKNLDKDIAQEKLKRKPYTITKQSHTKLNTKRSGVGDFRCEVRRSESAKPISNSVSSSFKLHPNILSKAKQKNISKVPISPSMSTIANTSNNGNTNGSNTTNNGNTPIDLMIDGDLDDYMEDKDKALRVYVKSILQSIDDILSRPSYTTTFLNYLCNSTSDPLPFIFLLINQTYEAIISSKQDDLGEAQVRAFDIFVTFIHNRSPLSLGISEDQKGTIWLILQNSRVAYDVVQEIFYEVAENQKQKLQDSLKTFHGKVDMGLGGIYGTDVIVAGMSPENEYKFVYDSMMRLISDFLNEPPPDSGHFLKHYIFASCIATYFSDVSNRYFKRPIHPQLLTVQTLFNVKEKTKSNKTKKLQKNGHVFHAIPFQKFSIHWCSHCTHILWNVTGQMDYMCSLCSFTVHGQYCIEQNMDQCKIAPIKKGKPKMINNQIPHLEIRSSPRMIRKHSNLSQGKIPVIQMGPTSPHFQDPIEFNRDPSVIRRIQRKTSVENKYNINHHSGLSFTQKRISKSGRRLTRSYSDRTSDRKSCVSNLRCAHSFKIERRASFISSPSFLSPQSSTSDLNRSEKNINELLDSISMLNGEEDVSKVLSSTSTPVSTNTSPLHLALTVKENQDFQLDEYVHFKELERTWEKAVNPSVLQGLTAKELKRQQLIHELICTERSHIKKLKIMLYVFKQPLLKSPYIFPRLKVENLLFPNLEHIISIHINLVNSMMESQNSNEGIVNNIGDILLDWFSGESAEAIKANHTKFALASENTEAIFKTWKKGKDRDQLKHNFITQAESHPLCNRLKINDMLALIWQRMTRYKILMEEIIKTYQGKMCEELTTLQNAVDQCSFTVGAIDRKLNEIKNLDELCNYQQKFDITASDMSKIPERLRFNNLNENGRKLLHYGQLTWKLNKKISIEVECLLLSDMMVLLEPTADNKLTLRCHSTTNQNLCPIISLSGLITREQAGNKSSFFVCAFEEKKTPYMYEFTTISRGERDKWEEQIKLASIIIDQKLKDNETQRDEHFKYKYATDRPKRYALSAVRTSSHPVPSKSSNALSELSDTTQHLIANHPLEMFKTAETTGDSSTSEFLSNSKDGIKRTHNTIQEENEQTLKSNDEEINKYREENKELLLAISTESEKDADAIVNLLNLNELARTLAISERERIYNSNINNNAATLDITNVNDNITDVSKNVAQAQASESNSINKIENEHTHTEESTNELSIVSSQSLQKLDVFHSTECKEKSENISILDINNLTADNLTSDQASMLDIIKPTACKLSSSQTYSTEEIEYTENTATIELIKETENNEITKQVSILDTKNTSEGTENVVLDSSLCNKTSEEAPEFNTINTNKHTDTEYPQQTSIITVFNANESKGSSRQMLDGINTTGFGHTPLQSTIDFIECNENSEEILKLDEINLKADFSALQSSISNEVNSIEGKENLEQMPKLDIQSSEQISMVNVHSFADNTENSDLNHALDKINLNESNLYDEYNRLLSTSTDSTSTATTPTAATTTATTITTTTTTTTTTTIATTTTTNISNNYNYTPDLIYGAERTNTPDLIESTCRAISDNQGATKDFYISSVEETICEFKNSSNYSTTDANFEAAQIPSYPTVSVTRAPDLIESADGSYMFVNSDNRANTPDLIVTTTLGNIIPDLLVTTNDANGSEPLNLEESINKTLTLDSIELILDTSVNTCNINSAALLESTDINTQNHHTNIEAVDHNNNNNINNNNNNNNSNNRIQTMQSKLDETKLSEVKTSVSKNKYPRKSDQPSKAFSRTDSPILYTGFIFNPSSNQAYAPEYKRSYTGFEMKSNKGILGPGLLSGNSDENTNQKISTLIARPQSRSNDNTKNPPIDLTSSDNTFTECSSSEDTMDSKTNSTYSIANTQTNENTLKDELSSKNTINISADTSPIADSYYESIDSISVTDKIQNNLQHLYEIIQDNDEKTSNAKIQTSEININSIAENSSAKSQTKVSQDNLICEEVNTKEKKKEGKSWLGLKRKINKTKELQKDTQKTKGSRSPFSLTPIMSRKKTQGPDLDQISVSSSTTLTYEFDYTPSHQQYTDRKASIN